jgi:hypothetical protein
MIMQSDALSGPGLEKFEGQMKPFLGVGSGMGGGSFCHKLRFSL